VCSSDLSVSGSGDTIPNLRIRPAPAPSGWSSTGSFSLFHIGGRSPNYMSGYAPLDNAYGNNPQQEDLHNGYTDLGGFYRAGGTRGTFLFDVNGVPFYANIPSVKAMIVPYHAQSNPDGGPVGTHPEDSVVLTKAFDPRDPEATSAQIGRWSTVIGDPEILEGLSAGGAIWSLARGLAWVSLQEIMHSMGEASMGPLPYGLLGGFNMDVGHYEDSWAVTVDGVRWRSVNATGYDWGFNDCAKTTVDVRLGPLERAYLRGTILRLDPWDRWPYINGVEAGFAAAEGDRASHSEDPRGAFRED
jgi:hypothetical protein